MNECPLCDVYPGNYTFIKRFDYWTLLINYMQPTLGSTLVVLNRHVTSLSDLEASESVDYWNVTNNLEKALRFSFNPEMINHLMLANVVRHVHYHVVPRYREPVEFMGTTFIDDKFGHMPALTKARLESGILDKIKEKILDGL